MAFSQFIIFIRFDVPCIHRNSRAWTSVKLSILFIYLFIYFWSKIIMSFSNLFGWLSSPMSNILQFLFNFWITVCCFICQWWPYQRWRFYVLFSLIIFQCKYSWVLPYWKSNSLTSMSLALMGLFNHCLVIFYVILFYSFPIFLA